VLNKLLTTITLLCFSVGAIAQDQEVWGCQMEMGTGLFWQNNRWEMSELTPLTLLVTIPVAPPRKALSFLDESEITDNRRNATYKLGAGPELGMFCRLNNLSDTVSCLSDTGNSFLLLNRGNGRVGFTSLLGAISLADPRDTVVNFIYNCTKF